MSERVGLQECENHVHMMSGSPASAPRSLPVSILTKGAVLRFEEAWVGVVRTYAGGAC